jgi:HNH endonuclease
MADMNSFDAESALKDRFNAKWTPEPFSGCHLWSGDIAGRGYGAIRVAGKMRLAHRLSWTFANGEIPLGMCVLHRCDTPGCVNPAHLFLGTPADNTRDSVAKGRHGGFKQKASATLGRS